MHPLIPHPLHLKLHRLRVTKSLWIPPSDPNARDRHSSKKSTMKMPLSNHWAPNRPVTLQSNMSKTLSPSMNQSLMVDPAHLPRARTQWTFFPPIPMMIIYLLSVTLNTSSSAKTCHPLSEIGRAHV